MNKIIGHDINGARDIAKKIQKINLFVYYEFRHLLFIVLKGLMELRLRTP
jgi:hypothetical protein